MLIEMPARLIVEQMPVCREVMDVIAARFNNRRNTGGALNFDDGERLNLEGLYTVSRDALRELEDVHVLRLFRSGHLQLAYTIAGSLNQLAVLAHLRNRRLAEGRNRRLGARNL